MHSIQVEEFVAAEKRADVGRQGCGLGIGLPSSDQFGPVGSQEFSGLDPFKFSRRSSGCESPREFDLLYVVRSGRPQEIRAFPGLLMYKRRIEKIKRLSRHGCGSTIRRCGVGIRPVEEREEWMSFDALSHQVNAALVMIVNSAERTVLRVG